MQADCLTYEVPEIHSISKPALWKQYGPSYSETSKQSSSYEVKSSASPTAADNRHHAGLPAATLPKGCGTFKLESKWSITNPDLYGTHTGTTETKTRFRKPPDDFQRVPTMPAPPSQFPKQNYPTEFRTETHARFTKDSLAGAGRSEPYRPKESNAVLLSSVEPQFKTAYASQFKVHSKAEVTGGVKAGNPATSPAPYNIITGSPVTMANNNFEHWENKDYRRRR